MKMNFKGLVDLHTLPKTTPLLPLYEAIINSIQSIEDAQISNGKIEIIVERDKQMNLFNQWETDIENIIIVDNGIGFDDENYILLILMLVNIRFKRVVKVLGECCG